MGKKPDKYFGAFRDSFEFREQQKAAETLNKNAKHFCKEKARRPLNVENDIAGNDSDDETDVSWPVPENGIPAPDECSKDAKGNAVETVDHNFIYPGSKIKIVDNKFWCDEDP